MTNMQPTTLHINDIEVLVEGAGDTTLLFIHGWPNDRTLWDGVVAALADDYRCVRFTLPGFDMHLPARPTSVADLTALLDDIACAVREDGKPMVLVCHDWGCVFGYEFAMQHPEHFAGVIGIDIGDHNSAAFRKTLRPVHLMMLLTYQLALATAWGLKGFGGNALARAVTKVVQVPDEYRNTGWQMAYPYAMRWFGVHGGLGQLLPVKIPQPMLFMYGKKKPFLFHSTQWADSITAQPHSRVMGFDKAGHWVMRDDEASFLQAVRDWLETLQ